MPVKVIVAGELAQIVVGNTLTGGVGSGKKFKVTLLGVVFSQLGVPADATLTILITVFAAKVFVIGAIPVPFKVMVWLPPPLMLYVTIAFGVPVKVIVAEELAQIVVGKTLTVAVGSGNTFKVILLSVVLIQLGVPDVATLTILITVLAAKVFVIVATPDAFKVIVWLALPLIL